VFVPTFLSLRGIAWVVSLYIYPWSRFVRLDRWMNRAAYLPALQLDAKGFGNARGKKSGKVPRHMRVPHSLIMVSAPHVPLQRHGQSKELRVLPDKKQTTRRQFHRVKLAAKGGKGNRKKKGKMKKEKKKKKKKKGKTRIGHQYF
jgi:hypothetical protein